MNFENRKEIGLSGFEGFLSISALTASACAEVPDAPGVYLVLQTSATPFTFLAESTGGHFKGNDPKVPISILERKSFGVERALVLYIGKAGGPGNKATLRSRLKGCMKFGRGEPVGKWGGRYIWQLGDSHNLLVCWKLTPNAIPRNMEKELLREFEAVYGKLPFANINR